MGIAVPGDGLAWILRHEDADFERQRGDSHSVLEGFNVEATLGWAVEGGQAQRAEVTRAVVEEEELATRVAGADLAVGQRGVPFIDRVVELEARIRAGPGGVGEPPPQVARLHGPDGLRLATLGACLAQLGAPVERIFLVRLEGAHEAVVDADGVVGVLAADGAVGLALPPGVVLSHLVAMPFAHGGDGAHEPPLWDAVGDGLLQGAPEVGIIDGVISVAVPVVVGDGLADAVHSALEDAAAGDE